MLYQYFWICSKGLTLLLFCFSNMSRHHEESSKASVEESRHHSLTQAFTSLSEMRKEGKFCDITLTAGDITISAHKAVLASRSSYFNGMFSSFGESKQDNVPLCDIPGDALLSVIDFIYNDKIRVSAREFPGREIPGIPAKITFPFPGKNALNPGNSRSTYKENLL